MNIEFKTATLKQSKRYAQLREDILKKRLFNHINGCIKNRVNDSRPEKIIVLYVDGQAVGCSTKETISYRYSFSRTETEIQVNVWVKPSFRKKGFGTELVRLVSPKREKFECFDTCRAANKMYSKFKNSEMI